MGSEQDTDCGICPGARAPRDVPDAAVDLAAPLLVGYADVLANTPGPLQTRLAARTERPGSEVLPPWRISPEGLTVFLV